MGDLSRCARRHEIAFRRDIDGLISRLTEISEEDGAELARLRQGAADFATMQPPIEAPGLASVGDMIRSFWDMRGALGSLVHFRNPIGTWAGEHLKSPRLIRIFTRMLPETAPAFFLLMVLGYLERGYLSRPVGGTASFRDALERTYRSLGGDVLLHDMAQRTLLQTRQSQPSNLTSRNFGRLSG